MYQPNRHTSTAHDTAGGWTAARRAVVAEASGVCARCGIGGADTAIRGWGAADLVAAHTRCIVGLGPPVTSPTAVRQLVAA